MAKRSKSTANPARRGGATEEADPSGFASAITRIAVSQICQYVGFRGIQTSALQILSDVAARYLRALAEAAASSAFSSGRTQSNLYDVVWALEDLNSVQGFRGASVVNRDLLASSTLADLASFVSCNYEIPFAKPIRRRPQPGNPVAPPPDSHTAVCDRFSHIPRWLPAIPDMGCAPDTITNNEEIEGEWKRCDDDDDDDVGGSGSGGCGIGPSSDDFGGKIGMRKMRMELPVKRERVRFKIGRGGGGLGLTGGEVCKGGKRASCQNNGGIVDDDGDGEGEEEEVGDEVCLKKMMLMIKKKKKRNSSSKSNRSSTSSRRGTKLNGR